MTNDERVKLDILSENFRAGLIIENSLLRVINGSYLLENMLKNNEKIPECTFNQRDSLKLILKYKRYDLLENVTIRNLLRKRNKNESFLDYILELSKVDKSINISLYDPFNGMYSLKNIADFYITYAKHDLVEYLPELTDELLLKKESNHLLRVLTFNKNFLSILFSRSQDKEFVKEKLLSNGSVKDLDVLLTMNDDEHSAPLDIRDNYSKKYYEEENSTLESIYIYLRPREKELIDELYDVMKSRCDKEAINAVIYSYIEQLHFGDKKSIYVELRNLIDIFKNDKTFTIKMGCDSHFSPVDNEIMITDVSTSIINHELGHMFYHKLGDYEQDPYFFKIIDNIRNNPDVLDKIDCFSNRYQEIKKHIRRLAIMYYDEEAEKEFSPEVEKEIEDNLNLEKEELYTKYKHLGYSKTVLENILNRTYTLEEYKKQHKQIQVNQLRDVILRSKVGPVSQISDIIDAIYRGEFAAKKLKNTNGKPIKSISGHGLFYYNNNKEVIFDEIFANYCALRKNNQIGVTYYTDSVKGPIENGIECLRAIVGDELVNYLEDYYQNKVLNSEKNNVLRR